MTLPSTRVTVVDGGLGLVNADAVGVHAKLGISSGGTAAVNELVAINDPANVVAALGYGPLADAVAISLGTATGTSVGSPVLAMRLATGTAGYAGDVVKTAVASGTGTGTVSVAGAAYNNLEVVVTITTTGTLGAGAFTYSLDGGDATTEEVTIPGGGTYAIATTNLTLTFTAGGGPVFFEAGDVFTFRTVAPVAGTQDIADGVTALFADSREWEGVHVASMVGPASTAVTSSGTTPPVVTLSGTPAGYFDLVVNITTGGTRGTAVFKFSLDGGLTYPTAQTGITTAATYLMPGTGVTLNFATGTYNVDNVYVANTCNFAGLATQYGAVKTHADTGALQNRFAWWAVEAPTVGSTTDTELIAGLASSTKSARMYVGAGFEEVSTPLDDTLQRRPQCWSTLARVVALPPSQSPGERLLGGISRIISLGRDERKTEALYAAKIGTLQSDLGADGFFVTGDGVLFSPAGSDYDAFPNRRVIDAVSRAAYLAARRYQSTRVIVDSDGEIAETSARAIELDIAARIRLAVPEQYSSLTCRVVRDNNILVTKTLEVQVRVVPFGYARSVDVEISLVNPALQVV